MSAERIFISHSGKDDQIVAELRAGLEGAGLEVWTDSRQLAAGDELEPVIRTAIEDARHFIVVLSFNAINSRWIAREIQRALDIKAKRTDNFKVIPILLGGLEPAALHLWFGDAPPPETVRVGSGGVGEMLPELLSVLGVIPESTAGAGSSRESEIGDTPSLLIRRLELQQFRCFERLALDFDRPSRLPGHWTCLVGINGAGKSSVLQALCLLLLGEPLARELGDVRLQRMRRHDGKVRHDAKIRGRVQETSMERYPEITLTDPSVDSTRLTAAYRPEMFYFWDRMQSRVLVSYGATRNLSEYRDTRWAQNHPQVRRQVTLFDPLAQVASADILLTESPRNMTFIHLFKRLMREVFADDIAVSERGTFSGFDLETQFEFTVERDTVGAIDLPDGFRSSTAWLADLCATWCEVSPSRAESGDPSLIEGTVLIDEIDLHLHPSLQRMLVPQLRRALPRVQWIVTSHSPLVLASFDSQEIVALDRSEPSGVRELDREILGFPTDQIYRWLMGTPATGAALDEALAEAEKGNGASEETVAEILQMSPDVDADEARERVRRMVSRLRKLKR